MIDVRNRDYLHQGGVADGVGLHLLECGMEQVGAVQRGAWSSVKGRRRPTGAEQS